MDLFPTIAVLALIFLILGFGVFVLFYRKRRLSGGTIRKIQTMWKEVESLSDSHPEQAILKADKLLDFALKNAGYRGSLGEKLQKARAVFRDNDAVWSAHKLRNRIAHEIDVRLSPGQTQSALNGFKKAFYDLGVTL